MPHDESSDPSSRPARQDEAKLAADLFEDGLLPEDMTLTCPSCDADLVADEMFASHRVCGSCHRHFSIPARERLALLIDPDTFEEITLDRSAMVVISDGTGQRPVGRLTDHRELAVIEDAVVAGTARVSGTEAVVVVLDDHLVGTMLGALMGEKIVLAFEHGLAWRLPVVVTCAGGGSRATPGPLAQVQASRLAASAAQLRLAGVPLVSILTHPTEGAIYAAIAAHSDVVVAEPGVRLAGLARARGEDRPACWSNDEDPVNSGWIDAVVDRVRLRSTIGGLLDLMTARGVPASASVAVEGRARGPATWNALAHVRHPERPGSHDYLSGMISSLFELRGDRLRGDDPGVVGGIGRLGSLTVMIAALKREHGSDEATAVRKLTRMARLAGRLEMPVLLLVDGSGGEEPRTESIEVCQSVAALAEVLAMIPVPVVCVGLGELQGPVAQAMMSGDRTYMQENAVSATGPNVVSAFESQHPGGGHWRPGMRDAGLVLTARECERLGLIDGVVSEPVPGAHADPAGAIATVAATVQRALAELAGSGQRRLLDMRHRRLRALGQSTPEGLAAVRSELWELLEWQKTLSRSIEGWRDRWDLRGQPFRLSFQRPDLSDLAQRLRARRAELLERPGRVDTPEE
jgi:acetyl-CoA carboxylase carboxyl transferase subunit beta